MPFGRGCSLRDWGTQPHAPSTPLYPSGLASLGLMTVLPHSPVSHCSQARPWKHCRPHPRGSEAPSTGCGPSWGERWTWTVQLRLCGLRPSSCVGMATGALRAWVPDREASRPGGPLLHMATGSAGGRPVRPTCSSQAPLRTLPAGSQARRLVLSPPGPDRSAQTWAAMQGTHERGHWPAHSPGGCGRPLASGHQQGPARPDKLGWGALASGPDSRKLRVLPPPASVLVSSSPASSEAPFSPEQQGRPALRALLRREVFNHVSEAGDRMQTSEGKGPAVPQFCPQGPDRAEGRDGWAGRASPV